MSVDLALETHTSDKFLEKKRRKKKKKEQNHLVTNEKLDAPQTLTEENESVGHLCNTHVVCHISTDFPHCTDAVRGQSAEIPGAQKRN
jgi:hypothetical protein